MMADRATSYSDFYKGSASTPERMAENTTSSTQSMQDRADQDDAYGKEVRKKALQRRLKRMKMRAR